MIYIILILMLIVILLLMNLLVDIYISEKEFEIKVFYIKIFKKKDDKFLTWISKISKVKQSEETKKIERNILKHLNFKDVEIKLFTIVNNENYFYFQNIVFQSIFKNIYYYFDKNIPSFRFKYQKSENNRFEINVKLKVNIFTIMIQFLKGKIIYGTKRHQSNA